LLAFLLLSCGALVLVAVVIFLGGPCSVMHGAKEWLTWQRGKDRMIRDVEMHAASDPDNAEVWVDLATVYARDGRNVPALEAALRAAELAPDDPWTWFILGQAFGAIHKSGREPPLEVQATQGLRQCADRLYDFGVGRWQPAGSSIGHYSSLLLARELYEALGDHARSAAAVEAAFQGLKQVAQSDDPEMRGFAEHELRRLGKLRALE